VSDYYPAPEAVLPLFIKAPPAQRHSETSRAAAASLTPAKLTGDRLRIYRYLRTRPDGATDEEIAAALTMNANTERPRRIELQKIGMIRLSGTRATASGRKANVWRVA
jgi:transcription initiation factor IIE alpha subunit